MPSLDTLLLRIAKGDNEAFAALYEKTGRGVYAFLNTYYKNHHDTEDAMQSVYLRIKQKIGLYKGGSNARAWILEIAKNYALNDIKRNARVSYTDDEGDFSHHATAHDTEFIITDLVRRVLSEDEEKIAVLHLIWGYRHREIAELLAIPVGTVTSKYKRAMDKLKKAIKEEGIL